MNTSDTQRPLWILGCGGHARVVLDAAQAAGFTVAGLVDLEYGGQPETILGVTVLGGPDLLDTIESLSVALALGDNRLRLDWMHKLQTLGHALPAIVHPRACVSPHARLGDAVYVAAGAVVCAGARVGAACILNTGSSLDHESELGEGCHLAPGARVAGRTRLGEGCFVGMGAVVIEGLTLGDRVMVGAGAAVIRDAGSDCTLLGVPAREQR